MKTSDLTCSALERAGCEKIFVDRASGARSDRPGLERAQRLGRTTLQLIGLLEHVAEKGIKLCSLQDGIDPSTPTGKAMLQIAAVFAEMERNLIRERTKAGLSAARARGRLGSRRPFLPPKKLDTAKRLMASSELTMAEVAARVGVSRVTLYRALKRNDPPAPNRKLQESS